MGRTQISFYWYKYRQTIFIYCFILFASTSIFTNIVFMAEGRAISNLIEVAQVQNKNHELNSSMYQTKAQIGSRPPKCEGRCRSCGHCEAVMVPVVPQVQSHRSHYSTAKATITFSSRGDNLSNYKPLSWKCKCGDYFFNP